jgi:hypothetical protein
VEFRVGGVAPTANLSTAELSAGPGFELLGSYRLMPHFRAYAGWGWRHFTTETQFAGADYDVEDTGYAVGLQFQHPVAGPLWGWLRAGPLYEHIELEQGSDVVADSGHEWGWEVGGGLRIPVTERLAVFPGARYRTFAADLNVNESRLPVDLRYVAVDLGVAWSFGRLDDVAIPIR